MRSSTYNLGTRILFFLPMRLCHQPHKSNCHPSTVQCNASTKSGGEKKQERRNKNAFDFLPCALSRSRQFFIEGGKERWNQGKEEKSDIFPLLIFISILICRTLLRLNQHDFYVVFSKNPFPNVSSNKSDNFYESVRIVSRSLIWATNSQRVKKKFYMGALLVFLELITKTSLPTPLEKENGVWTC